jgi:8-oxo-dGTP diphosphatase
MKPDGEESSTILIAAALLVGKDDRLLLVRKRGTNAFMQPGGKIEPRATPIVALLRELHEELGLVIPPDAARHLGRFVAPAANEPGCTVEAEVFRITVAEDVTPAAEIEEIVWIEAASVPDIVIAPLTRDHILPLHRAPPDHAGSTDQ